MFTPIRSAFLACGLLAGLLFSFCPVHASSIAISHAQGDSNDIALIIKQAWEYRNADPDSTLWLGKQALQMARQGHYKKLESLALKRIALGFDSKALNDSAIYYYKKSVVIERELNDIAGMGAAFSNIGFVYANMGQRDNALFYYRQAEKAFLQIASSKSLANTYSSIGNLWLNNGNDSARTYYLSALSLYRTLQDTDGIAMALMNIGNFHDSKARYDSALAYHHQALALYTRQQNPYNISQAYNNLGIVHYHLKQYDSAMYYYQASLAIKLQIPDIKGLASTYNNLGDLYNETQQYDSAKYCYIQSLEMARQAEAGDIEKKVLANLSTSLESRVELQKAQITAKKLQTNILLLSFSLLLALLVLAVVVYRNRTRTKLALARQNEENLRKTMLERIQQQERNAISQVMEAQEKERKRIGEDLHDRLGSLLSTAKLHVSTLEDKMKMQFPEGVTVASGLIDQACSEVRKVAHDISSGILKNFGLVPALQEMKDAIEASGKLSVELITHGLPAHAADSQDRLSDKLEISIYRIIQELVTNVIKHAQASSLSIQLTRGPQGINLIVEDNGKGMKPDTASTGMGMRNIQGRLDQVNGTMSIDSQPGRGTAVIIDIRLQPDSLPERYYEGVEGREG